MIQELDKYAENLKSLLNFGDEGDQFRYLIELARKTPEFTDKEQINENKMFGCMADVWIIQNQINNKFYYRGDSNAHIVKGLVAIITEILSGHTKEEIKKIKHNIVNKLGLGTGLTARRQVGMMAMIDHIKKLSGAK